LVDLYTWLHHFGCDSLTSSQVRQMWFTGLNFKVPDGNTPPGTSEKDLGLYSLYGYTNSWSKTIDPLPYCPKNVGLGSEPYPLTGGHFFLHEVYFVMRRGGACY
jgi:hypothetical protein